MYTFTKVDIKIIKKLNKYLHVFVLIANSTADTCDANSIVLVMYFDLGLIRVVLHCVQSIS